ncbi:MAG: 4-alpha-glucanotransferase [Clostridia bacterium]|nr:4-alpha-glucanotransferase [Clostridia bacterium]
MRKSGILLPVFSLPSRYGIGCFSKEAKKFIDFLDNASQSYWQILPLGPTSYGDSPYQSPSAFAGNPYFIDIDTLCADGLLTSAECAGYRERVPNGESIDYEFLYKTRPDILHKAFLRFEKNDDYLRFINEEKYWLDDYARFMAIKNRFGDVGLEDWEKPIRLRDEDTLKPLIKELENEIEYHKFVQYEFMRQWLAIKSYANKKGIKIIGDMPIYTAADSAEVWSMPNLFRLDENRAPTHVAGCPPDPFSPDGQLWGNPVYDWDAHAETDYEWWAERMKRSMRLYDVVRIDHFRGFESYYEIDAGSKTARKGKWRKGAGIDLFKTLDKKCPDLKIIAEDLGFITQDVKDLLEKTGYAGMKVLQFAFSADGDDYLPHNYVKNCIVYTGTHDNPTMLGWAQSADKADLAYAMDYMGIDGADVSKVCNGFVRLAMSSVADTCIIPLQDWLCLGDDARINTPGTLGDNWCWRMDKLSDKTAAEIAHITVLYGRDKNSRKADKNV